MIPEFRLSEMFLAKREKGRVAGVHAIFWVRHPCLCSAVGILARPKKMCGNLSRATGSRIAPVGRAGDPVLVAVEGAAVHGRQAVEVVVLVQVVLERRLRVLVVGAVKVAVIGVGQIVMVLTPGAVVSCCDNGCRPFSRAYCVARAGSVFFFAGGAGGGKRWPGRDLRCLWTQVSTKKPTLNRPPNDPKSTPK